MNLSLADLRKEYARAGLDRSDLDPDPLRQFDRWFQQAIEAQVPEPNAMTLATADGQARPSARTVLLKSFDQRGFIFYTNYESRKGLELAVNPQAALVIYWLELERQICVQGTVSKVGIEESRAYFNSRPRGHRLGAWVSRQQSQVIPGREFLETQLAQMEARYPGEDIPLPPYWGGYVLLPSDVEFWQGRPNRLHDRLRYRRGDGTSWIIERLSP